MKWILIGYLLNTLLVQDFDTREACEGRAVVLREAKAAVKCVEMPMHSSSIVPMSGWQFNNLATAHGN